MIRGNDIRCTCQWDRCTGSSLPSPLPGPDQDEPWREGAVQRTPVCGVIRNDDEAQKLSPSTDVAQRIFELVTNAPRRRDFATNQDRLSVCQIWTDCLESRIRLQVAGEKTDPRNLQYGDRIHSNVR